MSELDIESAVGKIKELGERPIREIKVIVNDFVPAGEPVLLCNRADFEQLKKTFPKPKPVICGLLSDPKEWT